MKTVRDSLKICSITLGSIIGAGFITGKELVLFYGADGFLSSVIFSCVLFGVCFFILFYLGNKNGGLEGLNGKLFERKKALSFALLFSSFVSFCSLLAVLDLVWQSLNFFPKLPVLSILCLSLCIPVVKNGIQSLEKLSIILVPICIIFTLICAFNGDKINFSELSLEKTSKIGPILYVCMNCFINLPPLLDTAVGKTKKSLILSSIVCALVISFLSTIIMSCVLAKKDSAFSSMPFLVATGNNGIFKVCLTLAVVSSVFSCFYLIYKNASKYKGNSGGVLALILAFVFSRFGFSAIVNYMYPVIGGLGALYLLKCIIFLCKNFLNKNKLSSNNKFIQRKGERKCLEKEKIKQEN